MSSGSRVWSPCKATRRLSGPSCGRPPANTWQVQARTGSFASGTWHHRSVLRAWRATATGYGDWDMRRMARPWQVLAVTVLYECGDANPAKGETAPSAVKHSTSTHVVPRLLAYTIWVASSLCVSIAAAHLTQSVTQVTFVSSYIEKKRKMR